MMDHMTEVSGLSWPRRILNTLQNDDRLLAGGAAFLGGLMTAMGRITGEVAPFGVAYAAAAPRRMTVPALLGAALGYLLMAAPPAAWQYPLAALLAVGLRQLLAVITHKARPWQNVIGVLIGLTAAVILPGAYRHPLVYDVLLCANGGKRLLFQPLRSDLPKYTTPASLSCPAHTLCRG